MLSDDHRPMRRVVDVRLVTADDMWVVSDVRHPDVKGRVDALERFADLACRVYGVSDDQLVLVIRDRSPSARGLRVGC